MIGIFLISFIIFPISVFADSQKKYSNSTFLEKQDTTVMKGIATCLVSLSHLISNLEDGGGGYFGLRIFTVMGGMGVLLFFFLSGYGLYKGYRKENLNFIFWKKRVINMYLPCVLIQSFFYIITVIRIDEFDIKDMIFSGLFGAWFIDVILIQYLIFLWQDYFLMENKIYG